MINIKRFIKKILNQYGYDVGVYPTISMDVRQMRNFLYFAEMYKKIDGIEGDVVECGVGKGRSFLYLSFFTQQEGGKRHIWGFDSFEGFPEPTKEDKSERNPQKGEWSETDEEYILKVLERAGINKAFLSNNVHLVKGFFNESLKKYPGNKIALLHIDGDLYQSYMDTLNMLFPLVVEGGIVLFDEYNEKHWPGAKRAVDEYFAQTDYKILRNNKINKYYIVKKTHHTRLPVNA